MNFGSVFSPKRFWFLIKKEFLSVFRPMLVVFGVTAIVVFIFSFISTMAGGEGRLHYGFFYLYLIAVGLILASLSFQSIHKKERNLEYLMIPASLLEKYLAKWLLATVGFIVTLLISSSLVSLLSEGLNQLVFKRHHVLFNPVDINLWKVIGNFMIIQAVFFLGGAYFKRVQIIATLFVLGLISFVCTILAFVFLRVVLGPFLATMQGAGNVDLLNNGLEIVKQALGSYSKHISWISQVFYFGLLAPFCHVIAFFRLKECQVNYGV